MSRFTLGFGLLALVGASAAFAAPAKPCYVKNGKACVAGKLSTDAPIRCVVGKDSDIAYFTAADCGNKSNAGAVTGAESTGQIPNQMETTLEGPKRAEKSTTNTRTAAKDAKAITPPQCSPSDRDPHSNDCRGVKGAGKNSALPL